MPCGSNPCATETKKWSLCCGGEAVVNWDACCFVEASACDYFFWYGQVWCKFIDLSQNR